MRLSKRLEGLARLVLHGRKAVDVGCDHGLLPCYLVKEGIAPFVIGIDVHEGPFLAACRAVEAAGLGNRIEIRRGDGLLPIEPGEAEVAIIAGMGGAAIRDILEQSPLVVRRLARLVLQPMNGERFVRRWLAGHGWTIAAEDIIEEDGRLYQIIAADKGSVQPLTERDGDYGPLLIKQRHPLLLELLKKDETAVQEILRELAKSKSDVSEQKKEALLKRLAGIKELEEWLSVAKQS